MDIVLLNKKTVTIGEVLEGVEHRLEGGAAPALVRVPLQGAPLEGASELLRGCVGGDAQDDIEGAT